MRNTENKSDAEGQRGIDRNWGNETGISRKRIPKKEYQESEEKEL